MGLTDVLLKKTETKKTINKYLYEEVENAGANFSIGKKQIFSLVRALLRDNPIYIIDEATSNLDFNSDNSIQHLLRNTLQNKTVITIAHRLNTIKDYDLIMVKISVLNIFFNG